VIVSPVEVLETASCAALPPQAAKPSVQAAASGTTAMTTPARECVKLGATVYRVTLSVPTMP
jgi:hypothetical protein